MSDLHPSIPAPKTPLGRYRVLSPRAGIRVSPIQLGGGSIGEKWSAVMGAMDKEQSFKLLDAYFDAGGNFIDTANIYQDGESESFIGEWAEKRGIRDQLVIATKYTNRTKTPDDSNDNNININFEGNNVKSMILSMEASLKRLRTTYIDIFYVHFWDYRTSIEEVMDHLHLLVTSRQVLYLGISNAPAWVVATANTYAKDHGKTPFAIYQGGWNVIDRSFEREIIPMAREHGLALAPWNVLAGGRLRTDAEEARREATGEAGRRLFSPEWKRNENERTMSAALEKVAREVGTEHITAVAIAYVMQKAPYVFPIIGGRKVEHLMVNIEALKISLSDEQIEYLESVLPFDLGFPHNFIGTGTSSKTRLLNAGCEDFWPIAQPIRPGTV